MQMLVRQSTNDAVSPEISLEPFDATAVQTALTLLREGRYQDVAEGRDWCTRALRELADVLQARARQDVQRVVDISVNANTALIATSEMIGHTRDVDARTQYAATAAEEMQATVTEISRGTGSIAAEAEDARKATDDALDAARGASAAMERITEAVTGAVSQVESLAEASQQIGEIVQQIEAIAKQTNLLALNATIEAARAGEAGRGFAVVANEVKTLANQTARATEVIRGRIEGLRRDMRVITDAMNNGMQAVEEGRTVVEKADGAMERVAGLVEKVTGQVKEVAGILGQQEQATREVVQAISTIAQLSQANMEQIDHVLDLMDHSDQGIQDTINDMVAGTGDCFTVTVAKSDHVAWRRKLAEMVAGRSKLNPDELSDHRCCRLGRWYYTVEDPVMTAHPAFKALEAPHADVHRCGIEAARLYKEGDVDGAIAHVERSAQASEEVLRLLGELGG